MNAFSHREIMRNAFDFLPKKYRKAGILTPEKIADTGNYPDYFDDPTKPDAEKKKLDPQWRKYTFYPKGTGTEKLHFFPIGKSHYEKQKLYACMLTRIWKAFANGEYEDFVKYMGCFSHAMGDSTQLAHIGPDFKNKWLSQMLPIPDKPEFASFHYHTTVEAVCGICASLKKPKCLGVSIPEIAWNVAVDAEKGAAYCRRFIIPTIQALFRNDQKTAEKIAAEPVTVAAQMTLNAVWSVLSMEQNAGKTKPVDLRTLPSVDEFHDLVYNGKAVLDGNMVPYKGNFLPGVLRLNGKIRSMPGLGVLPHSGMERARDCFMTFRIPSGVFRRFHVFVGMNAEHGHGAVSFQVELDGKEIWNSGPLTEKDDAVEAELSLGKAEFLTLRVSEADNGNSFWTNHAYWGMPELMR